ncbi:hypothetical protein SPRG_07347 [Saprolegnia parasitica CBS 223.65]|uniref:Homeobox domain-containing protein n=1 Tax=Saprolegnia parasitica (strain CBS 223.65) TaxID=695850 RepID=A0A067CAF8_SAPPC|nr:hypothetical protein SPRG_07347 [Saprolegnia parasitica CBS 223.65]KDO27719.1 hypothetical protein SPRG_07347 [Saprolegnia parasitica CBS 223.65]|eukprot:XP_012201524.1 hypothetical protein SPRG_07347 [Saprolegnia parasitica CBS 223.65]
MTLPNVSAAYTARPSASRAASPLPVLAPSPAAILALVRDHPLYGLLQRVFVLLETPPEAAASQPSLPSKRELAKLIAQAQAPAHAIVTPTLLVFLTLQLRMLRPNHKTSDDDDTSMLEDDKKLKRARLTRRSNEFMTAWFLAHKGNPYPSAKERNEIANTTQLSELQVRNWFANMRKRHWKPQNADKKPRCLLDLVLRRSSP